MNYKKSNYLICFLGSFIFGIKVAFCEAAGYGTDPLTVFLEGTYWRFGVTLGVMNLFINLIQIMGAFILDRKTVSIVSFFEMIGCSLGIDTLIKLQEVKIFVFNRVLMLLMGIVIYSFGCAVTQIPRCGYSAYDSLIFGIQSHIHAKYRFIRWGLEILFVFTGFILGGNIGIGTVLLFILAGPLIEIFVRYMNQFNKRYFSMINC